ncbi:hypothetical protein D3C78_1128520 [compost metagenome]
MSDLGFGGLACLLCRQAFGFRLCFCRSSGFLRLQALRLCREPGSFFSRTFSLDLGCLACLFNGCTFCFSLSLCLSCGFYCGCRFCLGFGDKFVLLGYASVQQLHLLSQEFRVVGCSVRNIPFSCCFDVILFRDAERNIESFQIRIPSFMSQRVMTVKKMSGFCLLLMLCRHAGEQQV